MRRAKIVCTIGPATESAEQIQALVDAGMDVARLNRSHGDTEVHERVYNNVRAAAKASGRSVAVLVDLQGPKIRLGRFAEGKHELAEGDVFTITTEDVPGTKELVSTTHKGLPGDARVGDPILIDDGRVLVRVTAVEGPRVVTRVEVPGPVSNNKGLNLPGVAVSVPAMSDKDESDLRWALQIGADLIALSFVRSAADYEDVRRIMEEEGRVIPVIAKIEKPQAVENLIEIVDAFDGIMVARGDLGRRAAARAGPAGAEARDRAGPAQRQAGHRRDPGARVDDLVAAPDARRGVRLRQRRARRRRRRHALGRDERGGVPDRGRAHDGPDHREHRGARPRADRAARLDAAHPRWRDHPGGRRGRRDRRRQVPRDVHAVRRLRASDVPPALPDPAAGVHAGHRGAQRARAELGRAELRGGRRSTRPTRWSSRSTRRSGPTAWPSSATTWWSSRVRRSASPGTTNSILVHKIGEDGAAASRHG